MTRRRDVFVHAEYDGDSAGFLLILGGGRLRSSLLPLTSASSFRGMHGYVDLTLILSLLVCCTCYHLFSWRKSTRHKRVAAPCRA